MLLFHVSKLVLLFVAVFCESRSPVCHWMVFCHLSQPAVSWDAFCPGKNFQIIYFLISVILHLNSLFSTICYVVLVCM
jgi:hypothetical protein